MSYDETSQKRILREMERDLLAIIAIDLETDEYEVIYSGGAYRNFENRYHNKDFFAAWNEIGIKLVFDPDRERMRTKSFTSQMQPHFLYNALSSIREIALTNPEYAADLLFDFTTHLRASIRAMASDEEI